MCRAGEQGAGTPEPGEAQHVHSTQRRYPNLASSETKQDHCKGGSSWYRNGERAGFGMQRGALRTLEPSPPIWELGCLQRPSLGVALDRFSVTCVFFCF